MDEERRMILRMLEEGKISGDQAAELLSAIEEGRLDLSEESEERSGKQNDLSDRVESVVNDTVDSIPSLVEKFLDNFNLGSMFGLGQYNFEEKVTGEIAGELFTVDLTTFNGRIEIETWDRPNYEVTIKKNVRANDEKTARIQAENMVETRMDGDKLEIALRRHGSSGGSIKGYFPANNLYVLNLDTSNGRIEVRGIRAKDLDLETSNGRVVFKGIAEAGNLRTSNGRIVFEGIRNVKARTSNGRIVVGGHPLEGFSEWDLGTSNGSITVQTDSESGYDISAKTSLGKIEMDLKGLKFEKDEVQRPGRAEVKGKTETFDSRLRKVKILARTTNGSIFFKPDVSEEE